MMLLHAAPLSLETHVRLSNSKHELPPLVDLVAREADFLYRTLQRLGVRVADCNDVLQSVLLTVHETRERYDGRAPVRAWLYGICVRHAAGYRRRAWNRRERPTEPTEFHASDHTSGETPETLLGERQSAEVVEAMLDELDADKRVVIVMYEIEQLTCETIAETLGLAVGTVHSRLHFARQALKAIYARHRARERRQESR